MKFKNILFTLLIIMSTFISTTCFAGQVYIDKNNWQSIMGITMQDDSLGWLYVRKGAVSVNRNDNTVSCPAFIHVQSKDKVMVGLNVIHDFSRGDVFIIGQTTTYRFSTSEKLSTEKYSKGYFVKPGNMAETMAKNLYGRIGNTNDIEYVKSYVRRWAPYLVSSFPNR